MKIMGSKQINVYFFLISGPRVYEGHEVGHICIEKYCKKMYNNIKKFADEVYSMTDDGNMSQWYSSYYKSIILIGEDIYD